MRYSASVMTMAGVGLLLMGDLPEAQSAGGLEEILVTAQRREQNLQDVGISVTAFTDDQVRNMGIGNTTDVAQMTPNLNFTTPQGAGSQINFFLRAST